MQRGWASLVMEKVAQYAFAPEVCSLALSQPLCLTLWGLCVKKGVTPRELEGSVSELQDMLLKQVCVCARGVLPGAFAAAVPDAVRRPA